MGKDKNYAEKKKNNLKTNLFCSLGFLEFFLYFCPAVNLCTLLTFLFFSTISRSIRSKHSIHAYLPIDWGCCVCALFVSNVTWFYLPSAWSGSKKKGWSHFEWNSLPPKHRCQTRLLQGKDSTIGDTLSLANKELKKQIFDLFWYLFLFYQENKNRENRTRKKKREILYLLSADFSRYHVTTDEWTTFLHANWERDWIMHGREIHHELVVTLCLVWTQRTCFESNCCVFII